MRRGTFMDGIVAGMESYMRMSGAINSLRQQRQQIATQRMQSQLYQRQLRDYQTPETPEERREASYTDWQRRQDYMRANAPPGAVGAGRGAGGADGGDETDPINMVDIKRANDIVSDMIGDFGLTTKMKAVWPTMVPARIRDMTTELVRSGQIGAAKGYLYSNYVFSTPEAKKKIKPVLKALGVGIGYDELVGAFTSMQAGFAPSGGDERLVEIGEALREHPKLTEMFVELGSMGFDGIHFEDISPYIEEATDLLYPGGREPTSVSRLLTKPYGWLKKIGSAVTTPSPKNMGFKYSGGYSPAPNMDESEAMWGALKKGVSVVKDWAKQQGRTLFDPDPEAMEAPGEIAPEAPLDTIPTQPIPEPEIVQQGTPRYDELMQKIQAQNPREEALKKNFEIQSRR